MKLRTNLIVVITIFLIIVSLPLITYIGLQTKQVTLFNYESQTQRVLEGTNGIIESYISNVQGRLENLAKEQDTIDALTNRDDESLNKLSEKSTIIVETSTSFENIGIHDETCHFLTGDKQVVAVIKRGDDYSSRDYCKGVTKTEQPYVSGYFVSVVSTQPVLSATVPVFSGGKMKGYLMGVVSLTELHASLAESSRDSYNLILDKYGFLFIDTRMALKELNLSKNNEEVIAVNEKIKQGINEGTFELGDNILSFKKFKYTTIIFAEQKDSVLALQSKLLTGVIFAIFLTIFILIVLVGLISRAVTKPLENLTKNVTEITKGNLDVQLGKSSISEIQSLIDSFNRILASMKLAMLRTGLSKRDIGIGELIKAKEDIEEKYKALYESSSDAIMTLEPPTWKFTAGNPATLKMFNVKDEKEFTSLGPWEVSPEKQPDGSDSGKKAQQMIIKAMKEGSNYFEWTHKRYKGEDFAATVLLTKVKLGGKEVLQATVRDLTRENIAIGKAQIISRREGVATGREEVVGKREKIKKGEGREGIVLGREDVVGQREKTATGREEVVGKRETLATKREKVSGKKK
jgi:PAS domain-containing protein